MNREQGCAKLGMSGDALLAESSVMGRFGFGDRIRVEFLIAKQRNVFGYESKILSLARGEPSPLRRKKRP